MKIKAGVLIFLCGIVIGVGLSPLINRVSQAAPISSLPASESCSSCGRILGAEEAPLKKISYFGRLINKEKKTGQSTEKPAPTASPSPKPIKQPTSSYSGKISIAVFGDSMIDVMGTAMVNLRNSLKNYYPQANIELYNYGIGAQNIELAYDRLEQNLDYQDRHYPSLFDLKPNIIILGSFSYNPFSETSDELYRHWAGLLKIVEKIKEKSSTKIILLAEIAPNKEKFGQGPKGVNWPPDFRWRHAVKIQSYLENTINFCQVQNLELVNAYEQSLLENKEGNLAFINPDDHIHQNSAGNQLMAELMAKKIFKLNLY